jgi:hypothetical protein
MIRIELDTNPVFRGERLRGSVYFSFKSYKAKKITVFLQQREVYHYSGRKRLGSESREHILATASNIDIGPAGYRIPFEYAIPENALFTFDTGLTEMEWEIKASAKSWLIPKKASKEVVILPHVLKSQSRPVDFVIPLKMREGGLDARNLYFHSWRVTGAFRKSEHLDMVLQRDTYSPGDTVSGTLYFLEDFSDADITVYLVFVVKSEDIKGEHEIVMVQRHDNFCRGSSFPFSFQIPETGYPAVETKNTKMWWLVRVVVSRTLKVTKVLEQEIIVKPVVV